MGPTITLRRVISRSRSGRLAAAAAALGLLLAAPPASAEWGAWFAELGTGFEYRDNLNNSAFRDDIEDDGAWTAGGRGGRVYNVSDQTRVSLSLDFASAVQFEFSGLNRVRASGEAAIIHKFGLGPTVPVLRVFGKAGYLAVDDSDRSGGVYETGFKLSKRFTNRLDGDLFFKYHNYDGGNGSVVVPTLGTNVWDQENFETGLDLNFLITDRLLASAGYMYRNGEFDSQCTTGNVAKVFAREGDNVKAIAQDKVFGGCVYRLGGDVHQGLANLNYAVSDHFAVDLTYKYQYAKADVLIYRTNIVSLSVLYRY
jgi:hypothetical protein